MQPPGGQAGRSGTLYTAIRFQGVLFGKKKKLMSNLQNAEISNIKHTCTGPRRRRDSLEWPWPTRTDMILRTQCQRPSFGSVYGLIERIWGDPLTNSKSAYMDVLLGFVMQSDPFTFPSLETPRVGWSFPSPYTPSVGLSTVVVKTRLTACSTVKFPLAGLHCPRWVSVQKSSNFLAHSSRKVPASGGNWSHWTRECKSRNHTRKD